MKLILIGGGEIGRKNTPYETEEIDKEIVKMANKANPTLLFIGLANKYSDSYYDLIKKNFKKLGCKTSYLKKNNLIHNRNIVENKFNEADIIYVGGGDTLKLLEKIEEYQLKSLFDKESKENKVLAGISAGAILYSKKGYSDSYILRGEKDTYDFINGLGYTNIAVVPHYHKDEEKTKALEEHLKKHKEIVYALEDGTALKIEDKNISVIKSLKDKKVFKVSYNKKLIEEEI